MSEATEAIRQDIDAIRDSMTDKMEQIESKVRGTVDTTVETVRRTFDIKQQVDERPWASLGVAVLAGYLLGSLGGSSQPAPRRGEPVRYYYNDPQGRSAAGWNSRGRADDQAGRQGNMLSDLADQFGGELDRITAAATSAAMVMLRDSLKDALPQFEREYVRARGEMPQGRDLPEEYDLPPARERAVGGIDIDDRPDYSSDPTEIGRSVPSSDADQPYRQGPLS